MKKFMSLILSASMLLSVFVLPVYADGESGGAGTEEITYNYNLDGGSYNSADAHTRRMEKLDRGLVAVKSGSGVYLSWRLWDSEDTRYGSADSNVSFNVYCDGEKIDTVVGSTNYTDTSTGALYCVAPVIGGVEGEKCAEVAPVNNSYFDIELQKPADMMLADGNTYPYTVNDVSCGDFDGDGDYELVVKWDCNGQDNSNSGYTGNVLLDAYDMETGFLWRVDLGQNIRAGAHYTQFLVYDFDGDGRAEMTCKTAPGSKDSQGNYVTAASADEAINSLSDEDNSISYVDDGGRVSGGDEYYTLFDENGIAVDTIYYPYPRNSGVWGYDSGGNLDNWNRIDRYLGAVAYLDGENPAAVTVRGYYDRTTVAAYTVENNRLQLAASFEVKSKAMYSGQGNHNITVADVDNDGKDEIITGAICWDDDLSVLWCSGRGHGDALHIGDYDPTNPGLEYFSVHESGGYTITSSTTSSLGETADYGMTVYRAGTGEELLHAGASKDTGRGVMANIGSGGYYQVNGAGTYQSNGGKSFTSSTGSPGSNFRIFWDGDLYDELLDGTSITNWNGRGTSNVFSASGCTQINGTKANPSLQADLFGDWREEVVYPTTDSTLLRVFTTTTQTDYKMKSLMQDPVYRSGVAAEQTAYNQPPHIGFYLSSEMYDPEVTGIEIMSYPTKTEYALGEALDTSGLKVKAYYDSADPKEVTAYAVSGYDPNTAGRQEITVSYQGQTAVFTVNVKVVSGIEIESPPTKTTFALGQSLNVSGLVVKVYYEGATETSVTEDYELSGYNASKTGEQTITVTYMGKTAEFKITVVPASIAAINGLYETTSSSTDSIAIGSFKGDFTIEHTVTINSMPANGSTSDRNSTAGFFLRFASEKTSSMNAGVGGGWTITASNNGAQIYWKSTDAVLVTKTPLTVGETYKFKYDLTHVGDGQGASAALTIADMNGNVVGSASGLNLRNFSNDNQKTSPINIIQIYNQASSTAVASITIDNAIAYSAGSISDDGKTVTVGSASNMKLYAVKFNPDKTIEQIEDVQLTSGSNAVNLSFEPDKLFLWSSDMKPIDMWEKQ